MKWRRWWSESHKWLLEKNEQERRGQISHIERGLKIREVKFLRKMDRKWWQGVQLIKEYSGHGHLSGRQWLPMCSTLLNELGAGRYRVDSLCRIAEMSVDVVSKDSVTVGGVGADASGHRWEVATHPGELTSRWMGRHHLHTYGQFCLSSWPNVHVFRLWE